MPRLSTPKRQRSQAEPLPIRNEFFQRAGLVLRRGQFSIVAAASGVGKSILANNLCIRAKVPSLYFSADSDEWTVRTRTCAILSGHSQDQVDLNFQQASWADYYNGLLLDADHVDWCYSPDIDPEFLVPRMQAYAEVQGCWPEMIVVDNLMNSVQDENTEGADLRATCRELQRIARMTGAHVMALHHVTGAKEDGFSVIGQQDLMYKLAKAPEIVLGLSKTSGASLIVNVAKYRNGRGGYQFQLPVDYERATIGGFNG